MGVIRCTNCLSFYEGNGVDSHICTQPRPPALPNPQVTAVDTSTSGTIVQTMMCLKCGMEYTVPLGEPASCPHCKSVEELPVEFSGRKYLRKIYPVAGLDPAMRPITVDVYCVLKAYQTNSAPVDHAVKKLLCAGLRGKADRLQDLKEARDAIVRAIAQAEEGD